jgi:ATP-dependent RNA helicase DOB1
MIECKINIDAEEYVESFKPSVIDVVHMWCRGAKFAEVCKITEIFEGNIIRTMRRLEELLREVNNIQARGGGCFCLIAFGPVD